MTITVGSCWASEASFGDERVPWMIYRQVRAIGATWADTLRFEMRAGGELVLHPASSIPLEALERWNGITEAEFARRLSEFLAAASAAVRYRDHQKLLRDPPL